MSIETLQQDVLKLPIDERISFTKLILESIEVGDDTSLDPAIKSMLNKRLAKIEKGQAKFYSWEEVKKRARTKIKK